MVVITRDTAIDKTINHIRDILRNNIIDTQGTLEFSQNISDSITDTSPLTTPWTDDLSNYKTKYTLKSNGDVTFQLYNEDDLKEEKEVINTEFSFIVTYGKKHRVMVATDSTTPVSIEITIKSYSNARNANDWIFDGMPDYLIKDPYHPNLSKFPLIELNYASGPNSKIINMSPSKPIFDSNKFSIEVMVYTHGTHGIRDKKQLGDQVINTLTNYSSPDSDGDTFMKNNIEFSSYSTSSDATYWSAPDIRRGLRILLNLKYAG